MVSSIATIVTRSGGAFTPRASVRTSVNADSSRSRNRRWPLVWPRPYRARPQSRAEQRNQNMKTSTVHLRVFYCPNLAIRAVTRAGGQRLMIRSPDGSTSTPSPAPSTTLAAAGGARHADAAIDDEHRCLCAFGVHRPFGAAHRRNRLRRHHVEPGAARLPSALRAAGPCC